LGFYFEVKKGLTTMGFYREVNLKAEDFYIDQFVNDEQRVEIIRVLNAIGGSVTYVSDVRYLGKHRPRWVVTLPANSEHSGSDAALAPQIVTLPGGRMLCFYPAEDSVSLGWLPGDSATSYLWHNATRRQG
jgi:hypothetical protein